MELKDNVISLFEYRINKQRIKEDELEQTRFALFMQQHSDDDLFDIKDEFEFHDED